MKKFFAIAAITVVPAAGLIYFFTRSDTDPQPVTDTTTPSQPAGQSQESEPDAGDGDAEHLSGANGGTTLDATDQMEVTVNMEDFRFDPQVLKIKVGTKVTWVNNGGAGHDVATASNSPQQFPASSLLATGQSYSFTFAEAGKYYYFCTPHSAEMRAIVEVVQ